jgi:translation elongation factor EF-G
LRSRRTGEAKTKKSNYDHNNKTTTTTTINPRFAISPRGIARLRLNREFGVDVKVGEPIVAYKEVVVGDEVLGGGMVDFEREIGGKVMKARIGMSVERIEGGMEEGLTGIVDNKVVFGNDAKRYLQMGGWQEEGEGGEEEDEDEGVGEIEEGVEEDWDEAGGWNACTVAVVDGIKGALQRGPAGGAAMTNVKVTVENIETENGYSEQVRGIEWWFERGPCISAYRGRGL